MSKDFGRCQEFADDYLRLCRKYNICLGHEDEHGALLLWDYQRIDRTNYNKWVQSAVDDERLHSPSSNYFREDT